MDGPLEPQRIKLHCSRCHREWGRGESPIVILCVDCFAQAQADAAGWEPRGPDRRHQPRLGPWKVRSERRRGRDRRQNPG